MVLAYGCCCGNNQNIFQNMYFKESFMVGENLGVTKLYKQCHSMMTWRKKAFAAAFLKVCESVISCQTVKKL